VISLREPFFVSGSGEKVLCVFPLQRVDIASHPQVAQSF
jgi:hypothetical protein